MRSILILTLALAACGSETGITNTRTITETVPVPHTIIETNTITNTVFVEDTGGVTDPDPCDLEFRAYAEDGHYVDVTVGAMPMVEAVGGGVILDVGAEMPTGVFEITSKQGCGTVEILGVQVLIVRADGAQMTKVDTEENELIEFDITGQLGSSFTATGWYGASVSSPTAPIIGMDWNSEWVGPEIGSFAAYDLGPNDSRQYVVRANALEQVPAGEYIMTLALSWRDPETGTEVWAADIDHADWHITFR